MRHDKVDEAVRAAHRFLDMVKHAKGADDRAQVYDWEKNIYKPRGEQETFEGPSVYVAAVKRASLDLTRALVDLRKRENQ